MADARLLHRLSIELIQEDGIAGLYEKIVQAAVTIMRSQYGTIQMLYPHEDSVGKLRILACTGFTPEAEKYWEWVYPTTGSTCGEVLRTGKRVIVSDYRTCEFMQGEPTLQVFLDGGIFAAQSTPLLSRTGKLVGMISTHWDHPYDPPQAHFELLEILALFQVEHRVLKANGAVGWIFSRAIPVIGTDGVVIEWFGAAWRYDLCEDSSRR